MGEALFCYVKASELYGKWGSDVLSKAWTLAAMDADKTAPVTPFRVTVASRARNHRAVIDPAAARRGRKEGWKSR